METGAAVVGAAVVGAAVVGAAVVGAAVVVANHKTENKTNELICTFRSTLN